MAEALSTGKRVKIGDTKTFMPEAFSVGLPDACPKAVTGRVVWIHPKGRFCLVEVEAHGHTWRQALPMDG